MFVLSLCHACVHCTEAAKEKQSREKEETNWQKIERQETLRPVSDILSDFREPVIPPTEISDPSADFADVAPKRPEYMAATNEVASGDMWSHLESPNKSDDTGFNSFGTGSYSLLVFAYGSVYWSLKKSYNTCIRVSCIGFCKLYTQHLHIVSSMKLLGR